MSLTCLVCRFSSSCENVTVVGGWSMSSSGQILEHAELLASFLAEARHCFQLQNVQQSMDSSGHIFQHPPCLTLLLMGLSGM